MNERLITESPREDPLPSGLAARLEQLFPGATVQSVTALGRSAETGETEKARGYGKPLRIVLRRPDGTSLDVVFHLCGADDYGHNYRADRAAEQLLAFDHFGAIPRHVQALDVGAIAHDGGLRPLADAGEFYLLSQWAEGQVYAEDLRRIAATGTCTALDLSRVEALARWALALHQQPGSAPAAYLRAWRDLVGSGEGIAGIVDGYGRGVPGASFERLSALEARCLSWRQRCKPRTARLRRIHGDFHPFNIVFATGAIEPTLLDTSRGSEGDPADDASCLSLNFLFFGLEHRERWSQGLGQLWRRFWALYPADSISEVAAPWFAWRALVVCNPAWYPNLREEHRDRLLRFVERLLEAERFEPSWGEEAMR